MSDSQNRSSPEIETARAYVERAIASYARDPADTQFQKGYLTALKVVRDEAFSAREKCPHCLGVCNPIPEGSGYCEKCHGTGWAQHRAPAQAVGACICQDQHRRGYCTEPGCPYNMHADAPPQQVPSDMALAQALHEAEVYGIGATSDTNQRVILQAAKALASPPQTPRTACGCTDGCEHKPGCVFEQSAAAPQAARDTDLELLERADSAIVSLLAWTSNWAVPFEGEDEWLGDKDVVLRLRDEIGIALSRPLAPTAPQTAWQPIDTAPKDGTEVLLKVKVRAGIPGKCLVGHYMPGGHCISDHPPIDSGWYFWNGCMFDKAAEPVEWCALPRPQHQEDSK